MRWTPPSRGILVIIMSLLLIIAGILVLVLPWCYWPRRGTRSRAALTGYRWGFTPLAILSLGLILWMYGRVLFLDVRNNALGEAIGIGYGLIGMGIAVVIGWITGIICAIRWKRPTDKCEQCGYSLVGLTSDKCPECGEPLS